MSPHTHTQPGKAVFQVYPFFVRGSAVQDQLRNVTDLAASAAAFAAIADGCLVTWGHPDFGGESYPKTTERKGVKTFKSNETRCFFLVESQVELGYSNQ